MPYISITVNPTKVSNPYNHQTSQIYKGFSTVNGSVSHSTLYDHELIKQDILNQFNVSQGERLMNPSFGTTVWKSLFEPFTDDIKQQIIADVLRIVNGDSRASATAVDVYEQEYGLLMQVTLQYSDTNQTEVMKLSFNTGVGIATLQ